MQNDKLIANSFDFSNVSFSLEEVPCSVQPLSFDESLCIAAEHVRVSVSVTFCSRQTRREHIRLSRIRANVTTAVPA